ncbi:MAG: sigma-70 family RNA polymerase sigma factor [Candidatus Eisenbacteria bacterium]|nr:sigma-70 family RNA polymerase sigma factor [Candidatus Eisenbacteria bacterium]
MSDKPTFEEALERCGRPVWAYLAGAAGDEETARDLTQETFLRAFRGWERFRGESDPFTWFYAIARNVLRRHWRKERLRRGAAFLMGRRRIGAPAAHEEEDRALRRELERVPQPYREALLLHYYADRSVREMARDLGVAEGTIKSRLARGREILKRRVERC